MVIKGSNTWKDITMLIISAILIPIIAWGSNVMVTVSKEVEVIKTQQLYNDKEFDKINSKLDVLIERRR